MLLEHWQMYMVFKHPVSPQRIYGRMDGAHVEYARGSEEKNVTYCTKDGGWSGIEFGERSQQGKRNDVLALRDAAIDLTKDEWTVINDDKVAAPFIRYPRAFDRIRKAAIAQSVGGGWNKPTVLFYWGPAGVGKSRQVRDFASGLELKLYAYNHCGWWDGYSNQEVMVVDDFVETTFKKEFLFNLLDGYDMDLQIKGAFVKKCFKYIFLTSNYDPVEMFKGYDGKECEAWLRRLDIIVNMTGGDTVAIDKGDELYQELLNKFT